MDVNIIGRVCITKALIQGVLNMHTSVLKGNLAQMSHLLNPLNILINSRHEMMMGI